MAHPTGATAVENMRVRAITAVILLASITCVTWPWLDPRLDWSATFDGENHLIRLFLVGDALKAGDWYPRWLPDLAMGCGYPLFNYYAPGMYALATALRGFGLPIIAAFQWTGVIAVALAATGTYVLARHVMGDSIGAIIAATAFVLAPYPFFTNLYDRAQVPEALALGILPWALLATWRAWHHGGAWVGALGVMVAALVLTHNITSLLASPLIAGVIGVAWWGGRVHWKHALRRVSIGITIGIGLSAFFWMPVILEASAVHLGRSDVTPFLFDPITTARDLVHAIRGLDWTSRAIFTALPETLIVRPPNHETIPIALLALATLGAVATGVSRTQGGSATRTITTVCAVGVAACLAMNATWVRFAWQTLPVIPVIQYAWRLYGPMSLMAALAGAGLIAAWRPGSRMRAVAIGVATVLVATLATGSVLTRRGTLAASPPPPPDGRMVFAREIDRYAGGTTSTGEFLPRTVEISDLTPGVRRGLSVFTDAIPEASWHAGLVRIPSGDAEVTAIDHARNLIIAEVDATTASTVAFHQFMFPGWRATVDGIPAPLAVAPYDESIHASLGYMVVAVPAGRHRVEVAFGTTPARVVGTAMSIMTLTLGLVAVAWKWRRRIANWARILQPKGARTVVVGIFVAVIAVIALVAWRGRPHPATAALVTRIIPEVAQNRVVSRTPGGQGTGPMPPFLEIRRPAILGATRPFLFMHPPSDVTVTLEVPPNAYLQAGLACLVETWETDYGDGVRFRAEVSGPSGTRTILDRRVNPRARREDRRWIDVWADLGSTAGETVRLTLRTDPAEDLSYDWCGWANPQVVRWDSPRPDPGTSHVWEHG
ncbi:MAG: hypothetical protein RL022_1250 [Chloroflexota bacterium]